MKTYKDFSTQLMNELYYPSGGNWPDPRPDKGKPPKKPKRMKQGKPGTSAWSYKAAVANAEHRDHKKEKAAERDHKDDMRQRKLDALERIARNK